MKKKKKLKKGIKFILILVFLALVGYCGYIYYDLYKIHNENNKSTVNNPSTKEDKELNKISIDKIIKENNLDFEVPKEHEILFKKYIKAVESNLNIKEYKKQVYNLFQILMHGNISNYIDEEFFFNRLTKLNITVNEEIDAEGVGGYYYDGDEPLIRVAKDHSAVIYHELTHFLDFSLSPSIGESMWQCGKDIYDNEKYSSLDYDIRKDCEYIVPEEAEFLIEAGAELYSAKFIKKGITAYYDMTAYLVALEYILGSEKVDELFLYGDSSVNYMKLLLDNGFTLEEYKQITNDLSFYTYPTRHMNYNPSGKVVDSLIELYKNNKKGKDWKSDETFKYILKSFLDIVYSTKFSNSKYKIDLEKLAYKSFEDMIKREKDLLEQIPADIDYVVALPPIYIFDNTVYLGSRIKDDKTETFAYFKYDFDKKKLSDFKKIIVE